LTHIVDDVAADVMMTMTMTMVMLVMVVVMMMMMGGHDSDAALLC